MVEARRLCYACADICANPGLAMNTRFRLLFILLGALLVAATFSFPRWSHLLLPDEAETTSEIFSGLEPELQPTFAALPPDQQSAYRLRAATDPQRALEMVNAALQPPTEVPEAEQALPSMSGAVEAATGEFIRLDPIRWAQGDVIIYEQADGSKVLRFENFSVINAPDLQVVLSQSPLPATPQEMRLNDAQIELGGLIGTIGAQNYEIPRDTNLTRYQSIVLYSRALDLIYSVAPLHVS